MRRQRVWLRIGIAYLLGILGSGATAISAVADEASESRSLEELNAAYRLTERDLVALAVFGEPELELAQRVDGSGRINLPLVGPLEVAGMTVREAEDAIENAYTSQEYLRDPEVTVMIREYASKGASVLGQVMAPGRIEFPLEMNAMNLVDVISRAGGFTGIAKSGAVRVTRHVDGAEETFVVDADRLIRGQAPGQDDARGGEIVIFPGDVIFVPESLF